MGYEPGNLDQATLDFLSARHLASLSIVVSADEVHVTPVGFTWDDECAIARVITFADARKVRLIDAADSLPAALNQIDGGYWLSLHGRATVTADPTVNLDAERRYAARYSPPRDLGERRRTIEIAVDRIIGRSPSGRSTG